MSKTPAPAPSTTAAKPGEQRQVPAVLLSVELVNGIRGYLGTQPHDHVAPLVQRLHAELEQQPKAQAS